MSNLREVNDDILKDWLDFREDTIASLTCSEDKSILFVLKRFLKGFLRNVPEQNKKYVEKQLKQLDDNFFDYICYWNEKYYRNGFCDGVQLIGGCFGNYLNIKSGVFELQKNFGFYILF